MLKKLVIYFLADWFCHSECNEESSSLFWLKRANAEDSSLSFRMTSGDDFY
jgi:hypothetical protein